MTRTAPPPDSVTEPWWDATRERRLLVQRCEACGHLQHPPRAICTDCASLDLGFVEATDQPATLVSWTVVHRSPTPELEAPYAIGIVELAERVRILASLPDGDEDSLACDQVVTLDWEPLDDGRHLPVFRSDALQSQD